MPDVPGKPGDAFDPEDESRPDEDSESSEEREESCADGIGEQAYYYPAAELLSGSSTSVVLDRIMNGDPLGVRQRCAERIRERCHLLYFDSLYVRAMARIAFKGVRYRGQIPFDRWMAERIDEAADDQLEQELEAERAGLPSSEPWETHYRFISELLGIEPGMTRRGCIRFNNAELPVRQIFFALCVDGITFNRYVAEGNGPPERAKNLLRQAYCALSLPDELREYDAYGEPDDYEEPDLFNDDLEELP